MSEVRDATCPWQRIAVDVAGLEFEARPSRTTAVIRPDSECDGWSTDQITLRYASVRGDKHRYYRQPRQDAVAAAAHDKSGAVVFAVADGVSGAESSEIGATSACQAAVAAIMCQLDDDAGGPVDCAAAARRAAGMMRMQARSMTSSSLASDPDQAGRMLATTLVAGAARPAAGGLAAGGLEADGLEADGLEADGLEADGLAVQMFRVGDSSAWILDHTLRTYRDLFAEHEAEALAGEAPGLVSNEVTALPEVPEPLLPVTATVRPGQVVLIGTDGFGSPLGDGDGLIGGLFADNLASPPPPLWLAHVLDFSRETFDDDRTLLALWPRSPKPPAGR